MQDKAEMDRLLSEFKELLERVSEDVSRNAVLPAVQAAQDEWSRRLGNFTDDAARTQSEQIDELRRAGQETIDSIEETTKQTAAALEKSCKAVQVAVASLQSGMKSVESTLHQAGKAHERLRCVESAHKLALSETQEKLNELKEVVTEAVAEKKKFGQQAIHLGRELLKGVKKTDNLVREVQKIVEEYRKPMVLGLRPRSVLLLMLLLQLLIVLWIVSPLSG